MLTWLTSLVRLYQVYRDGLDVELGRVDVLEHERFRDVQEASRGAELDADSDVIRHARQETAAERVRRRHARANVIPMRPRR